jgi:hypothetical protein
MKLLFSNFCFTGLISFGNLRKVSALGSCFMLGQAVKFIQAGRKNLMQFMFNGMCSGTETKNAKKTGNPYQITTFVELPSMHSFQLFGDFQLPMSQEVKQYVFEAGIGQNGNIEFPKLISVNPLAAAAPVKK